MVSPVHNKTRHQPLVWCCRVFHHVISDSDYLDQTHSKQIMIFLRTRSSYFIFTVSYKIKVATGVHFYLPTYLNLSDLLLNLRLLSQSFV